MDKFNWKTKTNFTMLTDFYELTMANGYLNEEMGDKTAYFDLFFRRIPDKGGFAIAAGLEQLIDYVEELNFANDDIEYFRGLDIFDEKFLKFLSEFRFTGDIYAIPEGTPVFPNEPLVTVKARLIEAQLLETMLLLIINHQSLIATKASRITRAAKGRPVIEFGARRAQGRDGAYLGARAAYIGGCSASSNVLVGRLYGIPVSGTMAHSWVQLFKSEYEAFKKYATTYPESTVLLVDTYNVLKSGVPNAIRVFDEVVVPSGNRPLGIRLDSGDLAYLSKEARKMLDNAGYEDVKIIASNSLDENLIKDLIFQDAKIDIFGVGEKLITASSESVFGGVYKLVAIEEDGEIIPKIKVSENVTKITNPDFKEVWRFYDRDSGKAVADILTKRDEVIDDSKAYELFDPEYTWKKKKITNFRARKLQMPVFENGVCVYERKTIDEIRDYCEKEMETLWEEVTRLNYPYKYFVDLSMELWTQKRELLDKYSELR